MPKIPSLDKINTATDVPCVRKGCKALSKARCISPEGVPSPRAHSPRQYLFGYLTLGTMPDKPTSMTDAEKEAADKLAQDYLGEIVVKETGTDNPSADQVKEVIGQVKADQPKDDAERIQDALDEVKDQPPVAPEATTEEAKRRAIQASLDKFLAVANPSDMLTTLIRIENVTDPQVVLDMLGENRAAYLEIMNLMNELELIDLQRQTLMDLFEDRWGQVRDKIMDLTKSAEESTQTGTPSPEVPQPVTTG